MPPPEPLERGVFISGWDSPVAFEADRSFVHPPALFDAMRARFGPVRFDDVDEDSGLEWEKPRGAANGSASAGIRTVEGEMATVRWFRARRADEAMRGIVEEAQRRPGPPGRARSPSTVMDRALSNLASAVSARRPPNAP